MPFIQTADETELFYNDWGTGKPVILIHGWPLDGDMWEYQWPVLAAKGHRVITYDRRGFGRSSQPFSGYDYDTFASDLQAIIETLDLHDVSLVGFSMGGGEVARYIGRYGTERLSKAVLVSAVTPYLLKTADNPDGVDKSVFDDMVEKLRKDRPAFLASFGKQFFGAGMLNFAVSSEIMQWCSNVAMLGSPKATIDCVRAFSETDFRADLTKFNLPTLIIHGEDDATVPIKTAGEHAAKLIPSATFKRYSGAPHGLFYTDKDKLNADLLAFF
ncbi:alpha/beta fold hydrolase [Tianweitania populi]|uniref:Arylesterase n=1 Tax=Tianweitania populi TaxID=1607949 RepID=A0A8J3DU89_9HYPH|nr:alpha/beta hydrolase [Tianweitania populi]GHD10612.1 arylesterase [Tianweitania populi]